MTHLTPISYTPLKIGNDQRHEVIFCIEPWGEEFVMPSGAVFEVLADAGDGHAVALYFAEQRIILYATSIKSIRHGEEELGCDY